MSGRLLVGDAGAWAYAGAVALLAVAAGLARTHAPARRYLQAPVLAVAVVACVTVFVMLLARLAPGVAAWTSSVPVQVCLLTGAGLMAGRYAPRRASAVRHERGARILTGDDAQHSLAARRRSLGGTAAVTLGGWPLSADDEARHVKLIGTTGTGKTTAITELLDAALRRGDRAVIADPDGGYAARYFDPARGDRILNPFDRRSARWDPFREIAEGFHVDELARALVPEADGSGREWAGYARTLIAAVLRQLRAAPEASVEELYRLIVVAGTAELGALLAGTPAQPFAEPGNERMFGSLRAVAANAVRGLDYVRVQGGEALAVREWIRQGSGVLFLPYRADQIAALRTLVSAWLRLAIFQTLSLEPVADAADRRLWFVVDELDALGAIDGLSDALARLRKFGGRCVLGFQSIAQVSTVYGAGPAQTIVENCANSLILRCSASEGGGTARFASRLIGDREVLAEQVTRSSQGPGPGRSSVSRSLQRRTEPALLAAQIEQLPDRQGFLKLASVPDWVAVEVGSTRG